MKRYNARKEVKCMVQLIQKRGHLKLFLGYAAGVGKTYSMLQAAHQLQHMGVDIVVGYIEPHARPDTTMLLDGLEVIPPEVVIYRGKSFKEVPLDAILKRQPAIVLIDELAHTNVPTQRHRKRYGDIEELLAHGIDVYATLNIQHIESLHDMVEDITKIQVQERVPDQILDHAQQIKIVDIAPEELLQRLQQGKIYSAVQAQKAQQSFFTLDNLIALREITLRRVADTIYHKKHEENVAIAQTDEHILVGLSSSPTNAKVIRSAARLAQALHAKFTALYVQTEANSINKRLQQHITLAEQLHAEIVVIQDDDVAAALANFAKVSGVTKLVVGKTILRKNWWRFHLTMSERIATLAPKLALHIVPDEENQIKEKPLSLPAVKITPTDFMKMAVVFSITSVVGLIVHHYLLSEANIITLFILSIVILSLWTTSSFMPFISSLLAVLLFNFLFTEPKLSFQAYHQDYPVTFSIMFIAGFITTSLMKRIKSQQEMAVRKAYRTEILLEANHVLQQAQTKTMLIQKGLLQLSKLVELPIQLYVFDDKPTTHFVSYLALTEQQTTAVKKDLHNVNEQGVVNWVQVNQQIAGITTDTFPEAKAYYVPLVTTQKVLGIIAIPLNKAQPLPSFEKDILHAMINDFSLALEKEYLQQENEKAQKQAAIEQARANLLRAVSHDLRTPLTSIAGNADLLRKSSNQLAHTQQNAISEAIYMDAKWLIQMVENLLAVSRLEEGKLALQKEVELIEDLIKEAIERTNSYHAKHTIRYEVVPELLFGVVDARLIIQVLINLLDNAIHYTPPTSTITIRAYVKEQILIEVEDDGHGLDEATKSTIFKPFITGKKHTADARRGLGLGLSLCKTIVALHDGEIGVRDASPHGTIFYFSLPKGEIKHE